MCTVQWPDNFDWETTRSINKPEPYSTSEKTNQEKSDSDSDNKRVDPSGDSYDSTEDELDRVALDKAFKFAATSSLALVSFLIS